jgi:DNA-binding MarR family transcriptional regulator
MGLVRKGILKSERETGKKRGATFSYTAKGRATLAKLDQSANQHISVFVHNLQPEELMSFRGYMKFLMDRDGAPPVTHRPSELQILVEMRRASRVWGFIGRSFLGSDLSAASWQLLSEIKQAGGGCSPQFLAKQFALSPTTISLNLDRLEGDGLVSRTPSKSDRRRVQLHLTESGEKLLFDIMKAATLRITAALEPLREEELREYVGLFAKYAAEPIDEALRLAFGPGVLRRLESTSERQRARAFLVENLVQRGLHHTIPPEILVDSSLSFTYIVNGSICAVAELKPSNSNWILAQYLVDSSTLDESEGFSFLEEIRRSCRQQLGNCSLIIPRDSLASQTARSQGAVEVGDRLETPF